jgi:uncharacterized protein (TIGR02597 family)
VQSTSSNTLTVSGTPNWTTNQFAYASSTQPNTYYALIGSDVTSGTTAKQGSMYLITSNSSNTLTLNTNGDDISVVSGSASVSVIPYWTLATVFSASNANISFTPTTSLSNQQTQLMFPNYAANGINASAQSIYFFYNGAWRLAQDSISNDHSNDVILPNTYFTVRNPAATTGTLVTLGAVPMGTIAVNLATQASGPQDNCVSVLRPIGATLANSGLVSSGAFAPTLQLAQRADTLLVFDNTQIGFNKAASAIYFYYSNGTNIGWRQAGQPITTDFGSTPLPVGSGFVIRKAQVAGASTQVWQHTAPYPID